MRMKPLLAQKGITSKCFHCSPHHAPASSDLNSPSRMVAFTRPVGEYQQYAIGILPLIPSCRCLYPTTDVSVRLYIESNFPRVLLLFSSSNSSFPAIIFLHLALFGKILSPPSIHLSIQHDASTSTLRQARPTRFLFFC